jgi:hypothetical protein
LSQGFAVRYSQLAYGIADMELHRVAANTPSLCNFFVGHGVLNCMVDGPLGTS